MLTHLGELAVVILAGLSLLIIGVFAWAIGMTHGDGE